MNVFDCIMGRRSVRRYKADAVPRETMERIVEAGLAAPSAMDSQGWHFSVVTDGSLIDAMNASIAPKLPEVPRKRMIERNGGDEDFSVFYRAPVVVAVSGPVGDGSALTNCGLAVQNMCLAAHALGVGSCIIGLAGLAFQGAEKKRWAAALQVPEGMEPLYAVVFGYADMTMPVPPRKDGRVTWIGNE